MTFALRPWRQERGGCGRPRESRKKRWTKKEEEKGGRGKGQNETEEGVRKGRGGMETKEKGTGREEQECP